MNSRYRETGNCFKNRANQINNFIASINRILTTDDVPICNLRAKTLKVYK